MAKRKHAAALFEVIHSDKRFGRSTNAGEVLRTPRWWFKGQGKKSSAPASDRGESGAGPAAPGVAASSPSPEMGSAEPGRLGIQVDPERQQISVRVSYTSAAITVFALMVMVALAYMVGMRLNRGPSVATASPGIEQLQQQPAQGSVLDVPRGVERPSAERPSAERAAASASAGAAPAQPAVTRTPAPRPSGALVAQGEQRQNNLNYVVVQSYPDQADAEEARDLLIRNGIGATIERGLRGLHPQWHIVVGTDGFSSISAPEYTNYLKRITHISDQTYSQKRSFKAFQPMGYKWDRAGE